MDQPLSAVQQQFNQVIRSGISAELAGVFQALTENAAYPPERYYPKDIRLLAQLLVCRNYSKSCLELAVLLGTLCQQHGCSEAQLLAQLYPARGYSLARLKMSLQQGAAAAGPLPGFILHVNRLSLLNALLEFLLYVDGRLLATAAAQFARCTAADSWLSTAKDLASHWQKQLYQFLEPHLPTAQLQRRYRSIAQWLSDNAAAGPLMTDQQILCFWLDKAQQQDDNLGFRRFRTAAENMLNYYLAAADGQYLQAGDLALSIGENSEQGELHPDLLQQSLEACQPLDISVLAAPVKCLSQQQLVWLEPIAQFSPLVSLFSLTLARMRVFGDWQAQLIQASRSNAAAAESLVPQTYQEWYEQLLTLQQQLNETAQALAYILLELGDSAAATGLAVSQQQREQWQHSDPTIDPAVDLNYVRALKQAKQAFQAINRQGFRQLPAASQLADYQLCQSQLDRLQLLLRQLQQHWLQQFADNSQAAAKFQADLCIISPIMTQREALYE